MTDIFGTYNADGIALYEGKLVCVERLKFPLGLAIPGGKRDRIREPALSETDVEPSIDCIVREYLEETGLKFEVKSFIGRYDAPNRDPRGFKTSDVYFGTVTGTLRSEEGKTIVKLIELDKIDSLKNTFAFDHYNILCDWRNMMKN
jgi:ADP-ribose pyrophosphatase YjhB (NUDIX family)